jgi:lipoate-protein ligase A
VTRRRLVGWRVERCTGSAATLLELWPPPSGQDDPVVRAGRVSGRPALVLGSTQDRAVVDEGRAAAAGVDVVRRSTGGGAVLVAPGAQVWLDLWVPRRHALWDDDIVDAATWLGDVWAGALTTLGAGTLRVHRGPSTRRAHSDLVCFAGLGPGEVHLARPVAAAGSGGAGTDGPRTPTSDPTGPKVMGLAQRRTRSGARFHTSAPLQWDPDPLVTLLDLDGDAGETLREVAVGLRSLLPAGRSGGADVDLIATVEDAVIAALP